MGGQDRGSVRGRLTLSGSSLLGMNTEVYLYLFCRIFCDEKLQRVESRRSRCVHERQLLRVIQNLVDNRYARYTHGCRSRPPRRGFR